MKVLIINQPFGNRGDEAAHKAMMRSFLKRMPDATFVVLSLHMAKSLYESPLEHDERVQYVFLPEMRGYAATYKFMMRHHLPIWMNLHPLSLRIRNYIKSADVVVTAPGGTDMGGYMDWHHVYLLLMVKYFKKPLAYYSRSFGPFKENTEQDKLYKSYSLEAIRYFSYIGIRDAKTERLAEELRVKYTHSIDAVFADKPEASMPELDILKHRYMVFVPNQLKWHYLYSQTVDARDIESFYIHIMKKIRENDPELRIIMLPQIYGYPEEYSDLGYMKMLASKVKDKDVIVLPDIYDSDQQQAIIRGAEYVIGARYHSIVFSTNQERPFIALSYELKISGLLAKLGMENRMVEIENIWTSPTTIREAEDRVFEKLNKITTLGTVSRTKANEIATQALDILVEWCYNNTKK